MFNVDCNGRNLGTRKEACFLCFIIAPTVILPTVGCDTVQVHTLGWCLHFATEDILHTRHALYLQQVNVYSIQQAQNGKSKQRGFFPDLVFANIDISASRFYSKVVIPLTSLSCFVQKSVFLMLCDKNAVRPLFVLHFLKSVILIIVCNYMSKCIYIEVVLTIFWPKFAPKHLLLICEMLIACT